ncbi:mitochondrial cardiolipin hydrolase-like [Argonauta hians]
MPSAWFYVGILSGTFIFLFLIKNPRKKLKSKQKPRDSRVIFFPDKKIACKSHFVDETGCKNFPCDFSHSPTSLSVVFELLCSARKSINICVYIVSCRDLIDVLLKLNSMGVAIKVISDSEYEDINNSWIWKLRSEGIMVRTDKTQNLMHHKFFIIDREILCTGSFNWTPDAVTVNHEHLTIIRDHAIVSKYHSEFTRLWNCFQY